MPEPNPMDVVFRRVWVRVPYVLLCALSPALLLRVLGPGNPWCALGVVWGTCALVPAVPVQAFRRAPRRWFHVPGRERVLHRIVGVGVFGWLLDVSGWNRRVLAPLRLFSGNRADLWFLEQGVRDSVVSHGIAFAIHVVLAGLALFTRHPWRGALLMLLPGVVVHLYPVLLQRSLMLRLQPLLVKSGA